VFALLRRAVEPFLNSAAELMSPTSANAYFYVVQLTRGLLN